VDPRDRGFVHAILSRMSGSGICAGTHEGRLRSIGTRVMADTSIESLALPLVTSGVTVAADGDIEAEVLRLFDRCAPQLLRSVAGFGLAAAETEDIVQEVFLAVFRHLHRGRDRSNLQGWLFQVAHTLALKQRRRQQRRSALLIWNDAPAYRRSDHAPTPE